MFFCVKCAARNKWPSSAFLSFGRCEICAKLAACNDVPSSALPVPHDPPAPRIRYVERTYCDNE